MINEEKLAILEKFVDELGNKQSITMNKIQKMMKSQKITAKIEYDEVSDYLAALGVTVIGESKKIKHNNPLSMYFKDIGDVEILGKERELEIAYKMRNNIKELQELVPSLTLSIKKFLLTGVRLEKGEIPIDDFSILSFRPDDITPTEHRMDIILAMTRIETHYKKVINLIHSSKKASIGERTYWDRKSLVYSSIRNEIFSINPSMKILEGILPIFNKLTEYWSKTRNRLDNFLKLAEISEQDAEKIFKADETERKKLSRKFKFSDEALAGVIKEYRKYNHVKNRIDEISIIPPSILLERILRIPDLLSEYEKGREQLVEANVRLVVNIARNYMNQGVDFLDLIQEGNHALLKAVERFDPDKGFKLATYAIWWIRQSMIRTLAEQGQVVRLPAYLIQWARKYSRIYQQLSQQFGHEPTNAEISKELDADEKEVEELLQSLQSQVSLDKKIGHDESSRTLGEIIEDEKSETPSLIATLAILQQEVQSILASLSSREAQVISLRFGLDDNFPRTLEEIGQEFGLSRERIRQIETRALAKLRHPTRLRILETFLKE
ncbi:sigma-70 family RNA polymerase sigma factor [bacterium]|nr:sigma-70 family RNA polymerase sigma factor [bacterium]